MGSIAAAGRVFSADKTVDSPLLNAAGAQPLRAVLARLAYALRRGSRDPQVAGLVRDGVALWEDFLPPDLLSAVDREARTYVDETGPTWKHEHGTTVVHHHSLVGADTDRFPHLVQWRDRPDVQAIASGAERRDLRRVDGGSLVEQLHIGDYSVHDTQTDLHVDTFFNTHKLWLYLDDVTVENAAFVYVPGSHRLDRTRLREDYRASNSRDVIADASRRVADAEVAERDLERRVVTCRRNALMVANTCGYHCRSVGQEGASRLALHKAFRFNPFSPFTPGVGRTARVRAKLHRTPNH